MRVKLKELGTISTGNTPSKNVSEFYDSEDIGFVKPDIISDLQIDYIVKTTEYLSEAARAKARIVKKDTVFVTCIGSIGKVGIAKGAEFAFNQQINAIEPNEKILPKYLAYSILANKKKLQAIANAPVVPIINKTQFGEFEIDITDNVDEQARIVELLDKVCAIITDRKVELEKLDELIKSRFVEMFGTLHDNHHGFDVVTIEEVCSLIKDGTHQTPQYTEDRKTGFKFLSSKDVMSQKIDWTDIKYIPAELHEKLYATIKPQRNDILMSKNGVNYGVAAVNDTDEIFDIYVSLALLRPKAVIDPIFFRCVINNPETKRQFDSSIKGIGVPNLHLGEIKKTKIFLPPIALQKAFVSFVYQVDKLKFEVQKSLDETQTLMDSLMQQYFG